jgi:UDP-xylose/UDP-N-acetylglucosamine transporter B4
VSFPTNSAVPSCNELWQLIPARAEPHSGHLITFAQFLLVAAEGFVYHFDSRSPTFLKPNQIPLYRWLIQILLFFSVSVLNNFAFGYNISVPVHIILRSGGSMTTMLIGWIWGKKYSRVHVLSVTLLTVGCILSAMGDSTGMVLVPHGLYRSGQLLTLW